MAVPGVSPPAAVIAQRLVLGVLLLSAIEACAAAVAPRGRAFLSVGEAKRNAAQPAFVGGDVAAPSPALAGKANAMNSVLPAKQPCPPTANFERPVDSLACHELEQGILNVDTTAVKANCSILLGVDNSAPRGCTCILERHTATWLTCPFDCSDNGGPACVAGAARQLGLTGLTASRPQPPPLPLLADSLDEEEEKEDVRDPYAEETVCTYWQWTSWYDGPEVSTPVEPSNATEAEDPVKVALETAAAVGRQQAEETLANASSSSLLHKEEVITELEASAPPSFTLPPSLMEAGPAPAPAAVMAVSPFAEGGAQPAMLAMPSGGPAEGLPAPPTMAYWSFPAR
mmetsp:Transcript_6684/g.16700  ORF Transcript_6684/g.16700 Transcript_6684/m.16700 type:complete len:343 (+) Transcript_6684:130-1158(+)